MNIYWFSDTNWIFNTGLYILNQFPKVVFSWSFFKNSRKTFLPNNLSWCQLNLLNLSQKLWVLLQKTYDFRVVKSTVFNNYSCWVLYSWAFLWRWCLSVICCILGVLSLYFFIKLWAFTCPSSFRPTFGLIAKQVYGFVFIILAQLFVKIFVNTMHDCRFLSLLSYNVEKFNSDFDMS